MRVKFVFDEWREKGERVDDGAYLRLSMGDFHSGSTFSGEIVLDPEQEGELKEAFEAGYRATFILYVR